MRQDGECALKSPVIEDRQVVPMAEKTSYQAKISRINEFGLCEVTSPSPSGPNRRAAFTLDKLIGYGGQPLRAFGVRKGAIVELVEDSSGRIESARVLDAATAS